MIFKGIQIILTHLTIQSILPSGDILRDIPDPKNQLCLTKFYKRHKSCNFYRIVTKLGIHWLNMAYQTLIFASGTNPLGVTPRTLESRTNYLNLRRIS